MAKSRELVLFYDPEGGERANTLKTVLVCMGVRVKSVSGNDFAQTVGHLLGRAGFEQTQDTADAPAEPMLVMDGFTSKRLDILLREMLQGFEEKLDKFLQENYITLRDNQYDAMISLTYNIGSGWMKESALATLLKNGTYSNNELASAIGIWCHVKSNGVTSIHDGLVARRISEINVFLYGDYSGEATGFYSVRFEQTEKGDRARDIAFYEAGSAYDPAFEATSDDGEIFLGWYTEDGTLLTDLRATQDLTVTARWQSDDAWV